MNKWQCPVCKGSKVLFIGDTVLCLSCGIREYLYDYRNAYDTPMPQPEPAPSELDERVSNLEAIAAEKGSIPRQYHDQFQQIRGEVAYLHKKMAEQPAKATPVKSGYKGLSVES